MNNSFFIALLLLPFFSCKSSHDSAAKYPTQTEYIDESAAIDAAKSVNHYFPTAHFPLESKLDSTLKQWLILSTNTHHTNDGACAKTNGCTVVSTHKVYVNALDATVDSVRVTEKRYPNYE